MDKVKDLDPALLKSYSSMVYGDMDKSQTSENWSGIPQLEAVYKKRGEALEHFYTEPSLESLSDLVHTDLQGVESLLSEKDLLVKDQEYLDRDKLKKQKSDFTVQAEAVNAVRDGNNSPEQIDIVVSMLNELREEADKDERATEKSAEKISELISSITS